MAARNFCKGSLMGPVASGRHGWSAQLPPSSCPAIWPPWPGSGNADCRAGGRTRWRSVAPSFAAVFTEQTSGFREDESTVCGINRGLLGIGQELTHGRARQRQGWATKVQPYSRMDDVVHAEMLARQYDDSIEPPRNTSLINSHV